MFRAKKSHLIVLPSGLLIALVIGLLCLLVLVQAGAAQEDPTAPAAPAASAPVKAKYDKTSEVTVKGNVEELKEVTLPGGEHATVLIFKAGAEIYEVRLCPGSFMKEMEFGLVKGDELEITGSKITGEAGSLILARQLVKGNSMLVLRDPAGVPVWNWRRKG